MKMIRLLLVWLASQLLSKELAALERYRLNIQQAEQWLASHPEAVELLKWLKGEGEGTEARHIGNVRAQLQAIKAHGFETELQQLLDDAANPRKVRFLPKLLIERLDAFTVKRKSTEGMEELGLRMQSDVVDAHTRRLADSLRGDPTSEAPAA